MLCCPICGGALDRDAHTYRCAQGHSYDIAREGYVNLLPANRKHAKDPGDDKEMVAARSRFLDGGHYAPLRETLCQLCAAHAPGALLDCGCGEGYYTAGIHAALKQCGAGTQYAGVDLSRSALKKAARRDSETEFAVATVYHLPVADQSIQLLLNCFSPLALDEFKRVLTHDGIYIYVVPGSKHLWQLKQVLYDAPYENKEEAIPYDGFSYETIIPVEFQMPLDAPALQDLFRMTPYYWKTPKEGAQRLQQVERLEVTASLRIHVFRRNPPD